MKFHWLASLVALAASACSAALELEAADEPSGAAASSSRANEGEPRCGDGRTNGDEACDPSAPAYSTFSCSDDCKPRKIYAVCTPDHPFGHGDCGEGFYCGGYGTGTGVWFCIPAAKSLEDCPKISGYSWVIAGLGLECLIPCTPDAAGLPSEPSQCPAVASRCFSNPFAREPAGWCSR